MTRFEEYYEPEGEWGGWRYREKLPSGMTMEMCFYDVGDTDGRAEINVELVVFRKRRERWRELNEVTGRDGAYPLARAGTVLEDIERFLQRRYGRDWPDIEVQVNWDDARRRDIYARGLIPRGYRYDRKMLVKQVRKNGVDIKGEEG